MRRLLAVAGGIVLFLGLVSAGAGNPQQDEKTHGRRATPDYERVFAQDEVKRLDIRVTAADWERLVADMTEMAGAYGSTGGGIGGRGFNMAPDPAAVAACDGGVEGELVHVRHAPAKWPLHAAAHGRGTDVHAASRRRNPRRWQSSAWRRQLSRWRQSAWSRDPPGGDALPGGGNQQGGNIGRDDVEFLPRTPLYIPATLTFDGISFDNIGLRLKGNSSLLNSWRSGAQKLPFRLNADGLEDQMPDVRDQTFFGFPNLNLTNNSQDASFLRAKVVGDLFREAGVPAARTAFVRVFFDRGAGSQYLGLYTLVEIPDEPMLVAQFGSENGNLYKPNGTGARWTVFDRGIVSQEDEFAG